MIANRLVYLFFRFRWLVALAVVAATVASAFGLAQIHFNDNLSDIFKANNDDYREMERFFDEFGADDTACVLILEAEDLFTPEALQVLRRLEERVSEVPGIVEVHSMLNIRRPVGGLLRKVMVPIVPRDDADPDAYPAARARALKHPLIAGQLLSEDGQMTLMIARIAGAQPPAETMRPIVSRLNEILAKQTQGTSIRWQQTGIPAIRVEIYDCVRYDQLFFMIAGTISALTIATLMFRRPMAVLIVCTAPGLGTLWAMGALGFVGEEINTLNNIMPALVMVVGFTDSVHLMVDIRRNRRAGSSAQQAAAAALRHLFLPCAMASLTTAIGFGSLIMAEIDVIQRFGLACSAGAILNFFAVITVVPLLSSTRLGNYVSADDQKLSMEYVSFTIFRRAVHWITGRARTVAFLGSAATVVMLWTCFQLRPNNDLSEAMPSDSPAYQALRNIENKLGGAIYTYVVVQWPDNLDLSSHQVLQSLADVHRLLDAQPKLGTSFSALNVLASLPRRGRRLSSAVRYLELAPPDTLQRFVRQDLHKAVVSIHTPDLGTSDFEPILKELETDLHTLQQAKYPGFDLRLTGSSVAASRNVNLMITDLAKSLSLAAVVIFVVITIAFRSIKFGLISVLPNTFPLAVAGTCQWLISGKLEMSSVVMFSICLGIAVDDTIHFMSRFLQERSESIDTAITAENAIAKVGAALLVTTIALVAGFGAGVFSQLPTMRNFSILACIGLFSALFGDVFILPAMLVSFSKNPKPNQPES